uniref:Integrase, catalytic region, zinc finger, CCHC-type, peptidase aspartic, catalytic n=1 Tax=Tanacetum cinerariifolium TaxID=118510 RepID=A0A6L2J2S8_TANCI|nr:hypothetical protein [Tanacetum cinerariifolium]
MVLKEELRKLKGKRVIARRKSVNKTKVIASVVHKVDLEPLSPKLKNNREAHVDYIRITKENADTLRAIVEQARTSNPLDNALAYAYILFQPLFDEYFNHTPCVVSPMLLVAAPLPTDATATSSSTIIDQDVPFASTSSTYQEIKSQVIHQGVEEQIHGHHNAQFDNAPILHNLSSDPGSEETTLQGFIPSNLHHLNQLLDIVANLTKNHPLKNVISDPSRLVSTRSQLQEHAIWCYFDANDNLIPFGGKRSG